MRPVIVGGEVTLDAEVSRILKTTPTGYVEWEGIIRKHERPDSIGNKVTIKGTMINIDVGDTYTITGFRMRGKNQKGDFFYFLKIKQHVLCGSRGTIGASRLLSTVKGIGPAIADRIVSKLGASAIETILSEDLETLSISGVSIRHLVAARERFEKEKSWKSVRFLWDLSLPEGVIAKIYQHLGDDTEKTIRSNCFSLSSIKGVGLKTVLRIADKIGIPPDRIDRLQASIMYVASTMHKSFGHTYLTHEELEIETQNATGVSRKKVSDAIDKLVSDGKLVSESSSRVSDWVASAQESLSVMKDMTTPSPYTTEGSQKEDTFESDFEGFQDLELLLEDARSSEGD